jgi:hypothetical protein
MFNYMRKLPKHEQKSYILILRGDNNWANNVNLTIRHEKAFKKYYASFYERRFSDSGTNVSFSYSSCLHVYLPNNEYLRGIILKNYQFNKTEGAYLHESTKYLS